MKSFVSKDIKSNNEQSKNYLIMTTFIKYTLVILFFLIAATGLKAQVGIGTIDPDTSVILDIQSPSKGVLLPRIATLSVKGIEGALIYFPDSAKFKYYHNGAWISVNPLKNDVNDNVTAPGTLKVLGSYVYAPNADSISARKATVRADNFVGHGITPIGGIIMWKGPIIGNFDTNGNGLGSLDGWAICDGNNGTPDLKGRFIAGYSGSDDYASIGVGPGGYDKLTLSKDNLPTHSHAIDITSTAAGGHHHIIYSQQGDRGGNCCGTVTNIVSSPDSHSANTSAVADHTHQITGVSSNVGGIYFAEQFHTDITGSPDLQISKATCSDYINAISDCSGNTSCISAVDDEYNNNEICSNPDYNSNYGNKVVDSAEHWDVQPFDNRPAYYVLAFIMRVK